jgi:hypothetical protein
MQDDIHAIFHGVSERLNFDLLIGVAECVGNLVNADVGLGRHPSMVMADPVVEMAGAVMVLPAAIMAVATPWP